MYGSQSRAAMCLPVAQRDHAFKATAAVRTHVQRLRAVHFAYTTVGVPSLLDVQLVQVRVEGRSVGNVACSTHTWKY